MRLVIQRVSSASVKNLETNNIVGKIGKGLFVLVGVGADDTKKEAEVLAQKLSKIRIMADDQGKMNLSVRDVDGEVLAVSQFTLYADTSGGNRPSFAKAKESKEAEKIYEHFVSSLRKLGVKVETGSFGYYMEIEVKLDGPVTIVI